MEEKVRKRMAALRIRELHQVRRLDVSHLYCGTSVYVYGAAQQAPKGSCLRVLKQAGGRVAPGVPTDCAAAAKLTECKVV